VRRLTSSKKKKMGEENAAQHRKKEEGEWEKEGSTQTKGGHQKFSLELRESSVHTLHKRKKEERT